MSARDPVEMLRELARAERAAFETTIDADQLLARVSGARRRRFRAWIRRHRRSIAGIVAVLVGAGGGTVAWAIVDRERATSPTMIQCFVEPRLGTSSFVISADGSDPAEQCAARWPSDVPELGPVQSPLVACKGPQGQPAVFPGTEDTCRELGLPVLDTTLSEQDQALIAFQDKLSNTLVGMGCVTPAELAELAAEVRDEVGLEGWTMTVAEPTTEQPCGAFGIDPDQRVISIQPLPDMWGEPGDG